MLNFTVTDLYISPAKNTQQNDIIETHNKLREMAYGSKYPLEYDSKRAHRAQQWADWLAKRCESNGKHPGDYDERLCKKFLGSSCNAKCISNHHVNSKIICPHDGQNIATITTENTTENTTDYPKLAAETWYNEINELDYRDPNSCFMTLYRDGVFTAGNGNECGHFSQMMWKNAKKIGCGFSKCKLNNMTRDYIVCNYDTGNINNLEVISDNLPRL